MAKATFSVKLTKEQGMAAGKAIMTDVRCTDEVKKMIKEGLMPANGGFIYTCTSAVRGGVNQWYDDVMIAHGVDNTEQL